MQKKLLGLAVAGALAAPGIALAQVEVYGFVNMSFGSFKYSGDTAGNPSVSKWDVASHASNYGIRGRENIGMGQTAWFQIEQNAPMERSNNIAITPASRNSAVGVQGNWGNVFIGQWTTPWADLDALWSIGTVGGWGPVTSIIGRRETTGTAPNPNCANVHNSGGVAVPGVQATCDAIDAGGGVGHAFWRRTSQSIFYQSPVFAGVQIKLSWQTNDGKATQGTTVADPQMWSSSVQWSGLGGRVRVGAAFDAHKDFTTAGKTDNGWSVKGGWNFGFMDIGLAYEAMTYKLATADCDAKQMGIALAVPIGQGAIRASYAVADDIDTAGCGAGLSPAGSSGTDNGAKTYNIGYDYRFSKRTTIGVGYATIKNDAQAAFAWTGMPPNAGGAASTAAAGSDPSTFFVNMVHRF